MHKIVCMDNIPISSLKTLSFPNEVLYHRGGADATSIGESIKDATIMTNTAVKITEEMLLCAPKLQFITSLGTGFNHLPIETLRERGIVVSSVPGSNIDAVSEHAFALYFAIKRRIVPLHEMTVRGKEWPERNAQIYQSFRPPRTCDEETLGIVGYGRLGKNVERIAKALGMKVLIAERKGATEHRAGRTLFETVLKESTVVIIVCPMDDSTRNMFDEAELKQMQPTSMLINVARGGIVNELALARALKDGTIESAGVDAFETEPATKVTCPLLDESIPNLVLTPHSAWVAKKSFANVMLGVAANIEAFVAGKPQNVVNGL